MIGRHQPKQPERNRHTHEFPRVLVVGEHAQRTEPLAGRGLRKLAMQDGLFPCSNLDQRLLASKAGAFTRELRRGVFLAGECRVDVPVNEERGTADRGHGQHADDDDAGDQDGRPGRDLLLCHTVVDEIYFRVFNQRLASTAAPGSLSLSHRLTAV